MPLYGIDASTVNTTSTPAIADPQYRFVIAKATEGQGWKSTHYPNIKKMARDNGKLFGAYHYAWTVQDPILEAQNFISYAQLLPGDIASLDIERANEMPPLTDAAAWKAWWEQVITFSLIWSSEVQKALNVKPIIYLNGSWRDNILKFATAEQKAKFTSHPQWFADPGANNTAKTPGKYVQSTDWGMDIHQYHFVGGIDKNWYAHSEEQWKALTIPTPVAPAQPTSIDEVITILRAQNIELASIKSTVGTVKTDISTSTNSIVTKITESRTALTTEINEVSDSVTSQAVAIEEIDEKVNTVILDSTEDYQALVNVINGHMTNLKTLVTSEFDKVKVQNDALPATVGLAVENALSGFSLTVSYPKRS